MQLKNIHKSHQPLLTSPIGSLTGLRIPSGSIKVAADNGAMIPTPLNPYPGDATNPEALGNILGLGLTSLGAGAAARSVVGLRELFAKAMAKRKTPSHPAVIEVSVPEVREEEENGFHTLRPRRLTKSSEDGGFVNFVKNWIAGRYHSDILSKPWVLPASMAVGAGGIYGGYKGTDKLLNMLHGNDRDNELEEAKEDYRKALVEQYTANSPAVKRASSDELRSNLDELYNLCKDAGVGSFVNDWAGTATGGALATLALLSGGAGVATYNWAKERSPEQRLAKALQKRERLRWATRPPEIYAVTKPKPVRLQKEAPEISEGTPEDQETIRKYATTEGRTEAKSSSREIASLYKP